MNEIKLAILRDIGLNNNGYAAKRTTVVNVRNAFPNATLTAVNDEFQSLVKFGHLKLLGTSYAYSDKRTFYCLPEDYDNIKAMMKELTHGCNVV